MASEIHNRHDFPYSAITFISVTFPDGTSASGTGAVVGRNDILTATHVLYSPDNGGWASEVRVYAGADYNSRLGRFDDQGYYTLENFRFEMVGWPNQVNAAPPYDILTYAESQYDVAVIGVDKPIGDHVGWFGLSSGFDYTLWANQIGYPSEGTGMMWGDALVTPHHQYWVYTAEASSGSVIMGPGSSGGPLYVMQDGMPYIIGVKSAGSATSSVWADISFLYDQIVDEIHANDYLLADHPPPPPPPPPAPPPPAPPPSTDPYARYDQIYWASDAEEDFLGGPGLDLVIYNRPFSGFETYFFGPGDVFLFLPEPSNVIDWLLDIERVEFSDGILALDVHGGETAGAAYRLYQAAFDRTPDMGGLRYWIDEMDFGATLYEVASNFVRSQEFQSTYGSAPDDYDLVYQYYQNILGRPPELGGLVYWLDELHYGNLDAAGVLASISESHENQVRVAEVIGDGLWLG